MEENTVKNEIDSFKTELVTGKDAATENTRFAIGTAEQTLEVPSMEEFNQLGDRKLSEPVEGLAMGKYFRVAALDENGHAVLEAVDAKDIGVQDVQLAGKSVVADGVANVPIATKTINNIMNNKISISKLIVKNNYYDYLKNNGVFNN